jgi:hypothetical protein
MSSKCYKQRKKSAESGLWCSPHDTVLEALADKFNDYSLSTMGVARFRDEC